MNASKDRFIHMLGHDIRNPLQGMLGTVQILHQEEDTLEEKERNQFVGMLKISVDRLNHLINDLLDWAQLESGMVQPLIRKVEIGGLLQKTCGLYHEVASRKNVEIRMNYSQKAEIETDPVMLETIFRNLLSNAIKFSEENSTIEISMLRADDALEVHFRDSGIGMSPEILGNLFKVGGNKSRSGTADEKGSGLGLLLVSELINILGGSVTVDSRENEGTVFSVTVPLKQAPGE